MSDSVWYEVDRVGDLEGNASRSLLFGSLGGEFRGRIALGEGAAADGNPEGSAFQWNDPQADGIFSRHVVIWGRDDQHGQIESVDLDTGDIERLTVVDGVVHAATADSDLARFFFVTVDATSGQPDGLWMQPVGEPDPTPLGYAFSQDSVSNQLRYRLVANSEGSFLAVQPMEGTITIIDVDRDVSLDVQPGGPIVGFAANALVAYGPPSETGSRSLVAIDLGELSEQVIAQDISSAQVVPGTDGDLVVVMRTSDDSAGYEIEAIDLTNGEPSLVYSHQGEDIGPLLARRDRAFLGYELPPAWVLLADSFVPFVSDPSLQPRNPPESSYPLALNARTGETLRLGPFLETPPN